MIKAQFDVSIDLVNPKNQQSIGIIVLKGISCSLSSLTGPISVKYEKHACDLGGDLGPLYTDAVANGAAHLFVVSERFWTEEEMKENMRAGDGATFRVWAPNAKKVYVAMI